MPDRNDLKVLIHSRIPIIAIEFPDETQVIDLLGHLSGELSKPLYRWSVTRGLMRIGFGFDMADEGDPTREPAEVLQKISELRTPGIFVLCDFHPYLGDPRIRRQIKEIALDHEKRPHTLVLLSYAIEMPPEWRGLSVSFRPRFPRPDELLRMVREEAAVWASENAGKRVRTDSKTLNALVANLGGLSLNEARRLARGAIIDDGAIDHTDLPEVNKARFHLMQMNGVLQYEYETASWQEVGGLVRLREWLAQRDQAMREANNAKDRPRGILLAGVQGSGKSLAAKAVAGLWHLPLLRLDIGALYNKFQGETERNLREALQVAETLSPCVFWIDEIEKGLSVGHNDDGVSRRILATFLTWLAEHKSRVFCVATANQIHDLPPELVRKGRFDELFFVDLPGTAVRETILAIHLRKRQHDPARFDLKALADATAGFSGAELEQVIVAAGFQTQAENAKLSTDSLLSEVARTRPLSIVMKESLDALRHWASTRCVPAD